MAHSNSLSWWDGHGEGAGGIRWRMLTPQQVAVSASRSKDFISRHLWHLQSFFGGTPSDEGIIKAHGDGAVTAPCSHFPHSPQQQEQVPSVPDPISGLSAAETAKANGELYPEEWRGCKKQKKNPLLYIKRHI